MPKSCRGKFIAQKPHAFINIGWVVSGCNSEQSGWPTCNGEYCCPCIIEDIMKIDISTSTNFSKLLYPSQGPFHFFQQIQNQKRMGSTTLFASYTFPLRLRCGHKSSPLHSKKGINEFCCSCVQASEDNHGEKESGALKRRSAIVSGVSLLTAATLGFPRDGLAVLKQGLLAGRIPGLSEPDEQGWRTYRRPDEKSGGHGVGWSPIIPYSFSVPQDWEEVPVSIADLGGTEIDLRFANAQEGRLFVIVAPVLRFADYLGEDARIENIGPPDRVINAFGPEVIGENVEGKVLSMEVTEHEGRKYYHFELEPPHVLITATAAGNRLYLFNVTANGLQWKRHSKELKRISETFRIV